MNICCRESLGRGRPRLGLELRVPGLHPTAQTPRTPEQKPKRINTRTHGRPNAQPLCEPQLNQPQPGQPHLGQAGPEDQILSEWLKSATLPGG